MRSPSTKRLTCLSGHLDNDETPFQAAERETKEEAGLDRRDYDVLRGFEVKITYPVSGRPKDVYYYLARLRNFQQEVQLSDEHQSLKWLSLQDACRLVQFEQMQSVLRQAEQFIENPTEL